MHRRRVAAIALLGAGFGTAWCLDTFGVGIPSIDAALIDTRHMFARAVGRTFPRAGERVPVQVVDLRADGAPLSRERIASEAQRVATVANPLFVDVLFEDPHVEDDDAAASEIWNETFVAALSTKRTVVVAVAGSREASDTESLITKTCESHKDVLRSTIERSGMAPVRLSEIGALVGSHLGPVDARRDPDQVLRRTALRITARHVEPGPPPTVTSTSLRPAWHVLGARGALPNWRGDIYFPAAPDSSLGVNTVSPATALTPGPAVFTTTGKCELGDMHTLAGNLAVNGSAVQAWLASAVAADALPKPLGAGWDALLVAICVAVLLFARRLRLSRFLLVALAATLLHSATGPVLFAYTNQMLTASALPLYLWLATGAVVTERAVGEQLERYRMRAKLQRYFPRPVYEDILRNPERLKPSGSRATAVLLYSDVRGFTSLVERYRDRPHRIFEELNDYFAVVTRIIDAHGGSLQHFVGDQILAFWGTPIPMDPAIAAAAACSAGAEIQKELAALREKKKEGAPASDAADVGVMFHSGIGIVTGELFAGEIGSAVRLDYGFVGDVVNLGARVEGMTRNFDVPVLIDEATASLVRGAVALRRVGPVLAQGRTNVTMLYEVVLYRTDEISRVHRDYEKALEFAERGDLSAAAALLECNAADDGPSAQLMERCRKQQSLPFTFAK